MDEASEFALFRAIVDSGGISAAALALQSSPAAVSRRLSAMEERLGVRLAERSSRRFRLTDEGLLLYERCRSILDQIRDVEAEVASRGGAARGLLRIGAPADFGRRYIAPHLSTFTAQHPGLDAHLLLSDIGLENETDNCALVFRFGLPSDPTMIARKIASTRQVVCASPSYVGRRGVPNSPEACARIIACVLRAGIDCSIDGDSRKTTRSSTSTLPAICPAATGRFCVPGRCRAKAYRGRLIGTWPTISLAGNSSKCWQTISARRSNSMRCSLRASRFRRGSVCSSPTC